MASYSEALAKLRRPLVIAASVSALFLLQVTIILLCDISVAQHEPASGVLERSIFSFFFEAAFLPALHGIAFGASKFFLRRTAWHSCRQFWGNYALLSFVGLIVAVNSPELLQIKRGDFSPSLETFLSKTLEICGFVSVGLQVCGLTIAGAVVALSGSSGDCLLSQSINSRCELVQSEVDRICRSSRSLFLVSVVWFWISISPNEESSFLGLMLNRAQTSIVGALVSISTAIVISISTSRIASIFRNSTDAERGTLLRAASEVSSPVNPFARLSGGPFSTSASIQSLLALCTLALPVLVMELNWKIAAARQISIVFTTFYMLVFATSFRSVRMISEAISDDNIPDDDSDAVADLKASTSIGVSLAFVLAVTAYSSIKLWAHGFR